MRIQVLRLPEVVVGDDVQTPFALVVDQADPATVGDLSQFRDECGARAVLVTGQTVDVVGEFAEPGPGQVVDWDRPEAKPGRVQAEAAGNVDADRIARDLAFQLGAATAAMPAVDVEDMRGAADPYGWWYATNDRFDNVRELVAGHGPILFAEIGGELAHQAMPGAVSCPGKDRCTGFNCPVRGHWLPATGPQRPGRWMDFGTVLAQIKQGMRATREGWNAPGQYVVYQPGYPDGIGINANTARATGIPEGTVRRFRPYLMLHTADGSFVPWSPTVSDVLADDWMIATADGQIVWGDGTVA